jgi:CheY-like chemotaxis protein
MDKDTQARIFEPFYTTKEMGRGTGLGLASVYGIIKSHNGIINVYSEKERGTTFNIYLPASSNALENEVEKKPVSLRKGSETILVVDDEKYITDVIRVMLEQLGYSVLIAESGQMALNMYKDNQGKIDLVILDMVMPQSSGGEIFDHLKEINHEAKVILSSGYSLNDEAKEILDRGCDGFLQKPYDMDILSQKLREVLD